MTLSQSFINEYIKLDHERDAGKGIWKLCEMSSNVVTPRGRHESLIDYKSRERKDGRAQVLASACRKSVDTIQRRAFAWRMWERFLDEDLVDENGEELDYTHEQIRSHLFWNHFAEIGRKVERGEVTNDTAAAFLIMAVKDGLSVDKMVGQLNETLEIEEYFRLVTWPKLRTRIMNATYRYPQVKGRRKRLMVELVSTDWEAKEKS